MLIASNFKMSYIVPQCPINLVYNVIVEDYTKSVFHTFTGPKTPIGFIADVEIIHKLLSCKNSGKKSCSFLYLLSCIICTLPIKGNKITVLLLVAY